MSEPEPSWNLETAEAAYVVISRYVEHAQVSGFIIAMLAGALGEERLEFLVNSEHWQKYMSSKRDLESSQEDIQKLAEIIARFRQ
ncbi:MAG TPA: hypothetical protein VFZ34_31135 [Blastocatellia bacterium]|nr:hypothetical protein [Blastocatellia bacterium]